MAEVHQPPTGGKGGDLPTAAAIPALDFGDPEAVRAWLARLRAQIEDAVTVGEDATRPPGRRRLGRAAAREIVEAAGHALGDLLATGDRGATRARGA